MNKKGIGKKIAIIIGIVEIIAMSVLFIITNLNMTKTLEDKAFKDMNVIAGDRAQLVETYIQGCCDFIDGYSKAEQIRDVLMDPDNADYIAAARAYTDLYAEGHEYLEGLYAAGWDTYVYAHINPDSVDKTFREPDSARDLEIMIKETQRPFCTGIVLAPVTKKMVIPVYAPVYDDDGEAIGFAGAAFFTDVLEKKFGSFDNNESSNIGYSLINAANNVYIFDNDSALVGTECTEGDILEAVSYFKKGNGSDRYYGYSKNGKVVSSYYMADRDWIFLISELNRDVFSTVKVLRNGLILACIIITVLMVIICVTGIDKQMQPLKVINDEIVRLQANDFSHNKAMDEYCRRDDEFGTIANAVKDLHSIMENQYELFLEMLKAQTVGTLVTDSATNRITLINSMAMKQFGFKEGDEYKVTLEDIYALLDEDEIASVREKLEYIRTRDEQTSFEIVVNKKDGTKTYLLVYANGVTLSNGGRVRIFSQVDITERKMLENNLLVLSETDSLTGLCNRRSGEGRINNALAEGTRGVFCLFDVNKFKNVNDSFGHAVGDIVLTSIADVMRKTFRTSDILIRLGGDEFVVFAANIKTMDVGKLVIDRFIRNIEKMNIEQIGRHKITISLGAVLIENNEDFAEMYSKADSLMYDCKKAGGNAYLFFED